MTDRPPPGDSAVPSLRGAGLRVREVSKVHRIWSSPGARLWSGALARAGGSSLLPGPARERIARVAAAGFQDVHALRGVSFDVAPGESVGIVGKNGSGKSTLLQIVAGVLEATSGQVESSGRKAALLELGMGFNPEFTGRENASLGGLVQGLGAAELEAKLPEIEAFADIGDFIDQPVRTYSTGMLMRLAFAVSVAVEPDLLIVDEILAVGDIGFQFKCLERLRRLIDGGTTVLLVSHDPVLVKSFCQKALYLVAGECRAFGATDEISELYFMDVREEQRRGAGAAGAVSIRPSLGDPRLLSFGTSDGRILEVCFGAGGRRAVLVSGETLEIGVRVEVGAGLEHPFLSLVVLSDKMVPIGGHVASVRREPGEARRTLHDFRYSFRAAFTPGRYFVTVRLEDGPSRATAMLVEKQTAALELEVTGSGNASTLGYVDLGVRARQWCCSEPPAPLRPPDAGGADRRPDTPGVG